MNKNELMNLRRKLVSLSGAGIIALTSLAGCSKPMPEQTFSQSIQDESLDLAHDNSKLMITVHGENGKKQVYLTDRKTFSDLQIYSDSKKYDKYFAADKAIAANTYIYIDIFTLEVIAVKYVKENTNFFSENNKEISFLSNEIVSEEFAFDYAKKYIGVKSIYTLEELNDMVSNVRSNLIKRQYSK